MRDPNNVAAIVNALRQVHGDDIARIIAGFSNRRPVALAAEKPRRGQTDCASPSLRRLYCHAGLSFSTASQIFL
jgi:hypothetical protein